jgi:hypothetical protein
MVQAIINIHDDTNRILNIIKAKHNLKDKSKAIDILAKEYEENLLEPTLRASYIVKANKIMKQKPIKIGSSQDLRKKYRMK